MNKNAETWVAALRSGKYPQTRGALRDDRGYCCLGVACDLYGLATQTPWQQDTGGFYFDGEDTDLPERVSRWMGLNDPGGSYKEYGEFSALSFENDNGMSFEDIASLIESEPSGLFESSSE